MLRSAPAAAASSSSSCVSSTTAGLSRSRKMLHMPKQGPRHQAKLAGTHGMTKCADCSSSVYSVLC